MCVFQDLILISWKTPVYFQSVYIIQPDDSVGCGITVSNLYVLLDVLHMESEMQSVSGWSLCATACLGTNPPYPGMGRKLQRQTLRQVNIERYVKLTI